MFEASSRDTNVSRPGDLYYSWRTPAGWTAATVIESLNSRGSDLMPRFDPALSTIYYTTAVEGGHATIRAADWPPLRENLRSGYAPVLAVANRSSHDVAFVDLARAEVDERVATGEGPHLLSNVSDGLIAATGYGVFPTPHDEPVDARPPFVEALNARLTIIDTADRAVTLDTVIENCTRPHHSQIIGRRVYVTCEDERTIRIVDVDTGRSGGYLETGQGGTHVLAFDASAGVLAAANTGDGSVTLFDLDSGERRILPLGAGSEGLLAKDGLLWVGNAFDGSVSVVDPGAAAAVGRVDPACGFPIALSAGSDGRVLIACFASSELIIVDGPDFRITQRIDLAHRPLHVIAHPARSLAYVSLPRRNAVAEIDLTSGTELRRFDVGIEPDGLRWAGRPD